LAQKRSRLYRASGKSQQAGEEGAVGAVPKTRKRRSEIRPIRRDGGYVLYWMTTRLAPFRPVFGSIRYTSSENTGAGEVSVKNYIRKHSLETGKQSTSGLTTGRIA
jgi:hypothetical protein